jgi:hypothetical protein
VLQNPNISFKILCGLESDLEANDHIQPDSLGFSYEFNSNQTQAEMAESLKAGSNFREV